MPPVGIHSLFNLKTSGWKVKMNPCMV